MSNLPNSQWDPNWNPHGQTPPKRGCGTGLLVVLLLGGLGSVLLIGFVAIVIVVASMEGQWDDPFTRSDLESFEPAQPQDWAAVRAAYNTDVAQLDPEMHARLQKLLDEFLRCSNEDDHQAFRQLVDHGRFLRAMKASRFEKDIDLYDQPWLRRHLAENVTGISGCDQVLIVAVVDTPQRGEKIVYAHGIHENTGHSNPLRFWVVDGRRPRLFDWELVEYGNRETGDWAVSLAYGTDRRNDAYFDGLLKIQQADQLWAEDDVDAAYEALRSVANNRVPPPRHDAYLLKLAYTWVSWGEPREALAICQRMRDIDSVPGALFVQAQAYQTQERHAECLAAAERYEAIVGRTPASLWAQAATCEELQRWDEAKEYYASSLKIMPADETTLDAWARLLDEDEGALLAAHLDKLNNKVEVATAMADRLSYNADIVDILTEVLGKFAPDSQTVQWLRAIQLKNDGEFDQAAAIFQRVIKDSGNESQVKNSRYRYMNCVIAAGTTRDAYEHADDPQFVFDYLVEDYEYEGVSMIGHDELVRIVDAHLKRFPDDAWNYYYASVIKEKGESPKVIEKLIRDGLRHAEKASDDDATASLNRRLLEVMFEDGRAIQAYRTIEPTPDTFRQLGDMYRYGDRPIKEFQAFVQACRQNNDDDPWLNYYQALVKQRQGRLDEAETLIERVSNTEEDELKSSCRRVWLDILIEQERYLDAYRKVAPPEETFDYLARHLHDEEKWAMLGQVIQQHREMQPDDARARYWETQMHWQQQNYARVADLMRGDDSTLQSLHAWERSSLRNFQLRSLLRAGLHDEARQLAQQKYQDDGDTRSLIVVHAAVGDVEQASARAREYAQTIYSMNGLYDDEDVGELLRGPEYAELRRIAPPSLPSGYSRASGVLLLDGPPALDLATVKELATQCLGDGASVRPIPSNNDPSDPQGHILIDESRRIVVTYGDGAYQADADLRGEGVTDDELLDHYEQHQGSISIDILEIDETEQAQPLLHKMLAHLIDERCLLVSADPGWLLAAEDENLRERLTSGELATDDPKPEIRLYHQRPTDDTFKKWALRRGRSLRKFSKLFHQRTEGQQFHLLVAFDAGDAQMEVWLPVVDTRRREPHDDTFIVQIDQPPVLFPKINAGDRAAIEGYRVKNWKVTDGEDVVFAY